MTAMFDKLETGPYFRSLIMVSPRPGAVVAGDRQAGKARQASPRIFTLEWFSLEETGSLGTLGTGPYFAGSSLEVA